MTRPNIPFFNLHPKVQGDPKKTIHRVLQLKLVVVVQFYFFHKYFKTRTRPSKLCEFCINSCAERRKMTAVN